MWAWTAAPRRPKAPGSGGLPRPGRGKHWLRKRDMSRIAGILVGVIWLGFTFMALSAASAGRAAGQPDVSFWWTATALFLGTAAMVAFVGTLRYRYHGPGK